MLASGRPVVGMADPGTELADVVQTCGVVVGHGDVPAMVQAIRYLAGLPALRAELGRIARAYADQHLATHAVIGHLERELLALAGGNAVTWEQTR